MTFTLQREHECRGCNGLHDTTEQARDCNELRIKEAPHQLFFKHEDRPLLVYPQKLVIGRSSPDELNRGLIKINVAFTLPPGSYATLIIRRLFHFCYREDTPAQIQATPSTPPQLPESTPSAAPSHLAVVRSKHLKSRRKGKERHDF